MGCGKEKRTVFVSIPKAISRAGLPHKMKDLGEGLQRFQALKVTGVFEIGHEVRISTASGYQ